MKLENFTWFFCMFNAIWHWNNDFVFYICMLCAFLVKAFEKALEQRNN